MNPIMDDLGKCSLPNASHRTRKREAAVCARLTALSVLSSVAGSKAGIKVTLSFRAWVPMWEMVGTESAPSQVKPDLPLSLTGHTANQGLLHKESHRLSPDTGC